VATTSDLRNGLCIDLNNTLYTVVEFQHVKLGKGRGIPSVFPLSAC
jgi:elongation factor P